MGCTEKQNIPDTISDTENTQPHSGVANEFAEVPQGVLMDRVRVYRFTFHFADGSVKVFDEELAFWGSPVRAIQELTRSAGYYCYSGNVIKKVEMEEIE